MSRPHLFVVALVASAFPGTVLLGQAPFPWLGQVAQPAADPNVRPIHDGYLAEPEAIHAAGPATVIPQEPSQVEVASAGAEVVPAKTAALQTGGDVEAVMFRLEDWFPASLHERRFLIADYQWISLLAVIILGVMADMLVRFTMHNLARAWFRIVRMQGTQVTQRQIWRPLGLLAQALVWYAGTSLVQLPLQVSAVLTVGLKIFAVWVAVWTAFQWIDILAAYFARRAAMTVSRFDDLLVPLVSKSLKIFTICMGLLFCAETLHLPIAGLLGGLGLGGAALAFASKDAISNLFGSLTVLVDRPFEIGDWIITDGVEGTVEQVGFRSTRVRTFYNSQISIPNSTFTTAVVDNMGRRHYQRIKTMLGVEYSTTTEQMEAFCEGIRELIRNHPHTRKDYFHVYFHQFGPSSLDILLNFFLTSPDRPTELQSQHDLFLDIIKLARALDVSFAFPTQTLHVLNEASEEGAKVLEFKQPAAVGRHEAAKLIEQRANRKRYPDVA